MRICGLIWSTVAHKDLSQVHFYGTWWWRKRWVILLRWLNYADDPLTLIEGNSRLDFEWRIVNPWSQNVTVAVSAVWFCDEYAEQKTRRRRRHRTFSKICSLKSALKSFVNPTAACVKAYPLQAFLVRLHSEFLPFIVFVGIHLSLPTFMINVSFGRWLSR